MDFNPKTQIIDTTTEKFENAVGLQKYADKKNMQAVSKALNELTDSGISHEQMENQAHLSFAKRAVLSEQLNSLKTQIEDISEKIKTVKKHQANQPIYREWKKLTDRKKKKFEDEHKIELQTFQSALKQLHEWYPTSTVPSLETLTKRRNNLIEERNSKNEEYKTAKHDSESLGKALQTIEDYLSNERAMERKRKSDLE